MKEWCKAGCLPDDNELVADLKAVDFGYDASDAILLERKDDMKRRGLASPDDGDALALTFAYPSPSATGPRSGGSRKGSRGCAGGSGDASRHIPFPHIPLPSA